MVTTDGDISSHTWDPKPGFFSRWILLPSHTQWLYVYHAPFQKGFEMVFRWLSWQFLVWKKLGGAGGLLGVRDSRCKHRPHSGSLCPTSRFCLGHCPITGLGFSFFPQLMGMPMSNKTLFTKMDCRARFGSWAVVCFDTYPTQWGHLCSGIFRSWRRLTIEPGLKNGRCFSLWFQIGELDDRCETNRKHI